MIPKFGRYTPTRTEFFEACLFTEWGLREDVEVTLSIHAELTHLWIVGTKFIYGHNLAMMLTLLREELESRDSFPQD